MRQGSSRVVSGQYPTNERIFMLKFRSDSGSLIIPQRSRSRSLTLFAIVVILTAAFLPLAHAGNKFWTGAANGNFNNAGNWTGGTPVAGDDLVFQSGVTRLLVTNDFSPNRAFNSLFFQGSNYVVRGNAILVTNGIGSNNSIGTNHIDADVDVRVS
jgi:hypothetical protein